MSYLVLARKYRPQSFADLVGQEHVATTLANAIAQNRVAHAFLFTGVRGVGKTTSARLLAKCLNCLGADGKATGPTATPCQSCAACNEIAAGNDMDVQEIDGASYNGVDEVRRLQEGLAFRPARDRFKVYIVDEVHMLSNAAWNAFLKTLEEPPPHVKFIFATTEVHKVPATILSRCQRYDFKLISAALISGRLREVLGKENLLSDDEALSIISREAAGSMRDAMSLLDQVIAYGGSSLKGSDVARVLGVADSQALFDLSSSVLGGDATRALEIVAGLSDQGFDLVHLSRHLLRQFRDLVVTGVSGEKTTALVDLSVDEITAPKKIAHGHATDELLRVFHGFSKSFDDIARSGQPKMALEMTLVRLAHRPALVPVSDLLAKVLDLETRLGTGGAARSAVGGSGAGGSGAGGSGGGASELGGRGSVAVKGAGTSGGSGTKEIVQVDPIRARTDDTSNTHQTWRAILQSVRVDHAALASVLEHAVPSSIGPDRVVLAYKQNDFLASQVTTDEAKQILLKHVQAFFGRPTEVAVETDGRPSGSSVFHLDQEKKNHETSEARRAVEESPLVQEMVRVLGAELKSVRLPGEEN